MKRLLVFIICACTAQAVRAQNHTVSGCVVDKATGNPIPFASISLKGTYKGTTAAEDGTFLLEKVPGGQQTLEAWVLGYDKNTAEITVEGDVSGIRIPLSERSSEIDEVVVTATRTERVLLDVPIATQVISGHSLEKMQQASFRDLLEYEIPGVEFTNNGGYANINMLGFGGKYVLFLVDGERMAGESFDNIDYNRIDMDNIERIEIVKGASSSLYGSNAVGGVINIITKKPDEPFQINAGARYGSRNEINGNLTVSSKLKWGTVSVTGTYKSMSPYLLKERAPLEEIYPDGTIVEKPQGDSYVAGYTSYNITPKLTFNISDKLNLELRGGYFFNERNPGGIDGTKVRDRFYDYNGRGKLNWKIADNQNFSLSAHYDRYDKYDFYMLLDETEKNYENSQFRTSLLYDLSIKDKHYIVAGADFMSDMLMTYMFDSEGANDKREAYTWSVFTQQEWQLLKPLTLVAGLRYDYHSQFKGHLTPRIAFMYRPVENIAIRGGYAGGFRSPTLKELYTNWWHPYGGGFQIVGNADMKAEISNNFNISADMRFGKTAITAMAQYSDIQNKINSVWLHEDTIQYRNVGHARVFSTELTVTQRIGRCVSLQGSYTFVKDDLGKNSTVRPHTATFKADYTATFISRRYSPTLSLCGKWLSGMDTYGVGVIDDGDVSGIEQTADYKVHYEGYTIWRLSLDIPLPFNISLSLGINNLFGYTPRFSSFYSSISPGRTYYIALRWRLR